LNAGVPDPPPIEQLFRGLHFGVPDFDAGRRYLQSSPVELSRQTKELGAAFPPPATVVAVTPDAVAEEHNPLAADNGFRVEVIPTAATRDLAIRRVADSGQPQEFGFVKLVGAEAQVPVIFNGKAIAQQLPVNLQLPIGQYEIRLIREGQITAQQTVDVTANGVNVITVKP